MNHVVIIGFMGSGKTRVGKQLSKDLGLPFVDLEKIITKRMNLSAREIFERFGEPYYRALETLALKQLIQDSERKVISLGAGLPLQEQNEKYLRELGTVVYLKGSLATLKKRLEGSKKDPMLDGEDRDDKIKKLLKQRDPSSLRAPRAALAELATAIPEPRPEIPVTRAAPRYPRPVARPSAEEPAACTLAVPAKLTTVATRSTPKNIKQLAMRDFL